MKWPKGEPIPGYVVGNYYGIEAVTAVMDETAVAGIAQPWGDLEVDGRRMMHFTSPEAVEEWWEAMSEWARAGRPLAPGTPFPGIYVFRSDEHDYWKVGKSTNIRSRLQSIQHAVPFPVRFVMAFAVANDQQTNAEGLALETWSAWSARGEWFRIPSADIDHAIKMMHDAMAPRVPFTVLP